MSATVPIMQMTIYTNENSGSYDNIMKFSSFVTRRMAVITAESLNK